MSEREEGGKEGGREGGRMWVLAHNTHNTHNKLSHVQTMFLTGEE